MITNETSPRLAAMRKRCKLLMVPPKEGDAGYDLFQKDPIEYQECYGCPCQSRIECHFRQDVRSEQ